VLIPSCYELPADARPGAREHVLWVGTIHPYKRPEWFLDMAERLPGQRFVLVGGQSVGDHGGYFDKVRSRAERLPNVEFTGFRPLAEVEKLFDRARVLVSTSMYEGMPNVFLQAWARGVPTIATVDVGASASTVVIDAEEGASKLEALLSDEVLWARRSAECLAYFQRNHSSEEVLGRYARLLDELTA
jgi:glycosyltransferase involved in cell wall biosynthesis